MMVPAAAVDQTLNGLVPLLERDDVVIDGGNSYYHDDIRRDAELQPKGIHYVDVGTSGGVWGMDRGYCLMIGGDETAVRRLDPIFAALAPGIETAPRTPGREKVSGTAEHGYLHCGPAGAGHFVKMVHNGIEYGVMAAYAEGLNILHHANAGKRRRTADAETTPLRHPEHYQYDLNLAGVSEVTEPGTNGHHLCYSAGVMVLSKEHPRVIRHRSTEPVLTPLLPQERHGIVPNVVFPTGIDRRDDLGTPDRVDVYYGMADKRIGVARLDVPERLPPGALADAQDHASRGPLWRGSRGNYLTWPVRTGCLVARCSRPRSVRELVVHQRNSCNMQKVG